MGTDTSPAPPSAGAQAQRRLTADEQDAWQSLVAVMVKLPAALDAQLQRSAALTLFEYLVLAGLSEAPDRTRRMSDLAVLANASPSRLSHAVKRLEKRGWVRREPCARDGRSINAVLTDAGWDKVVASTPGHLEAVRRFVVDPLTAPQLRHLTGIGHRILRRVEPDNSGLVESTHRAE
ncbi:MarR family winged helix-turn-helix transcriptional regulator [Streptomyces sp. NPDC003393]